MRLIAVVLLMSAFACAQQDDVAAAARANRQNQQQAQDAPARVITNDDLGYGHPKDNEKSAIRSKEISKLPKDKQDQARKIIQQILQQREQIAKLQDHYNKLQEVATARANLETPPRLTPATCVQEPEQCENQRALATDLVRTAKQLDTAEKKLDDLQDSARKQGYPPSVFDP